MGDEGGVIQSQYTQRYRVTLHAYQEDSHKADSREIRIVMDAPGS